MASGYGRGGRGAALLQAMSQPVRKPGESSNQASSTEDAKSKETKPPSAPAPLGRGAIFSALSAQASAGGDAPPKPLGRGLAHMQALLQAAGQSMPPTAARGAAFLQQATQVQKQPDQPKPSTSPVHRSPVHKSPPHTTSASPEQRSQPAAPGDQPPVRGLAAMSLDRQPALNRQGQEGKPYPQEEETANHTGCLFGRHRMDKDSCIALSGNYIRIKCLNKGVYQYHVDFNPVIDSRNMRYVMMNEHRDVIGNVKVFDGSILFLPIELPQKETVCYSVRQTDNTKIQLTIKLVKTLPPEACTQLYNILFRKIMRILEMVQVGRYYYNPQTPTSVPQHKLEIWPGYITSVAEQEGGLMLLADASHRVLRTETVFDVMQSIVHKKPESFRDELIRTLVGTVVLTQYNNKTYRVDDIIWDKSPKTKFSTSKGEISFMEYYKKNYNLDIRDEGQPLLLHRPKKKAEPGGRERKQLEVICLIPELCHMTGLTDALRNDFNVMKDLACHTRVTPEQRRLTMKKFINSVNNNQEARQELEKWGLQLDTESIEFQGRVLPIEDIQFKNKKVSAGAKANWARDATNEHVITAVPLRNWVVVYTRRDEGKASDYINCMLQVCPSMGIEIAPPTRFELKDDRTETYIRSLRDHINPRMQIIVAICPTSRDDRYSAIKKTCCVDHPIPSQVINGKTLSRRDKLKSITQKIALQINCKLGGELWAVPIPFKTMMIVGIDVYHDKAGKKRSICGFVASMNRNCTRWFSMCRIQSLGHQELVDGLKFCLIAAIKNYHEVNHLMPDKILVFRDGVGDGQLNTVTDYEVAQLADCFHHFGDYEPKLTVVIVQKRINTRLFLKTPRQMENPPPGTVADHTVTRRDRYDFYLVSQHVTQGTVTPTHYIVVSDNSGMKVDHLQRMAYKMTHLYYNWPGTVRVPAPCQYAHKLAYLVGQNIHKEPSRELSDRLFFL